MSNAAESAASSDEQIEEFDTEDEESDNEVEPIDKNDTPKSTVFRNPDYFKALKPSPAASFKPVALKNNRNQFNAKNFEKKITINIKTPLIIEDKQNLKPKSPDNKETEEKIESDDDKEPEKQIESDDDKEVLTECEKETEQIADKKEQSTTATDPDYAKHLSYEGSLCIYTEPGTGRQLIWNAEQNAWVSRTDENNSQNSDNSNKSTENENDETVPGSPISRNNEDSETVNQESDENVSETKGPDSAVPGGIYGFEGDTHTYTDPNDGSVYMWDKEKSAWFPKVDDEFLARYQMSYGFIDPSAAEAEKDISEESPKVETKAEKEERKAEAKRKAQEPATWFEVDEAHNTAVYITGLPLDITMEELTGIVTKYGLLARDDKAKDKMKLYRDKDGQPKGDALVTYIKVESVNLALHLLDGSQIRGNTLSVQRAKFQMKGTYDPGLKPKRKRKDKDRAKKIHEKLFDWRPEPMRGEPQKCERVVIIKNLFSPEDFDKEVTLLLEYQQDLRAECSKCGDVKKVVLYDRHPEGVAQVTFKEPSEAQACIQLLNGRWFAQKQISAEIWDGKTKYKIAETDAEIEERIAKWDKFLDDEDEKKEAAKKKAAEDSETGKTQSST